MAAAPAGRVGPPSIGISIALGTTWSKPAMLKIEAVFEMQTSSRRDRSLRTEEVHQSAVAMLQSDAARAFE